MNKAIVMAALTAPALAACYPMEQAPLVYASKSTIGVSIAAGTPDNPGLDLIIGYKDTNAALVPVAVAKRCLASSSDCEDGNYKMQLVSGGKLDIVDSSSIQETLQKVEDSLRVKLQQLEVASENMRNAEALETSLQDKQREVDELLALRAAEGASLNFDAARKQDLESKRGTDIANIAAEVTKAKNAAVAARQHQQSIQADVADLNRRSASLQALLRDRQSGERKDAYSVYGTFEGTASGSAKDGGLNAGRVFATGIAAQNISEFAGIEQCLRRIGDLVEQLPSGSDDEKKKRADFITQSLELCKKPMAQK